MASYGSAYGDPSAVNITEETATFKPVLGWLSMWRIDGIAASGEVSFSVVLSVFFASFFISFSRLLHEMGVEEESIVVSWGWGRWMHSWNRN